MFGAFLLWLGFLFFSNWRRSERCCWGLRHYKARPRERWQDSKTLAVYWLETRSVWSELNRYFSLVYAIELKRLCSITEEQNFYIIFRCYMLYISVQAQGALPWLRCCFQRRWHLSFSDAFWRTFWETLLFGRYEFFRLHLITLVETHTGLRGQIHATFIHITNTLLFDTNTVTFGKQSKTLISDLPTWGLKLLRSS